MPDITSGSLIRGRDLPPAAYDGDDTLQLNLSVTTYTAGTPEVGVNFTAPTSGRVRVTIGGGLRDSSGIDRVFLAPQIFEGPNATAGTEIVAPGVPSRGLGSPGTSTEFAYASRTTLLQNLTPGAIYYARVMYVVEPTGGTPNGTADIGFRDIAIIPVP